MSIPYEQVVKEDLNLGRGSVSVTMPAGGTATGTQICLETFLPNVASVLDFGAVGDGVTDDTVAIQAAITAIKGAAANNGGGGHLWFPGGRTYVCKSALDLSDAFNLELHGAGSRLLYTGAGTVFLKLASAQRVRFTALKLHYNNAAFTGTLITMGHSSGLGTDPAYVTWYHCEIAGIDGAVSAAHLIDMDTAIICALRSCKLTGAVNGLRLGPVNYTNSLLVEDVTFVSMGSSAATMAATQAVTFRSCTFEQSATGKSAGIKNGYGSFSYAFNVIGCWFGDVSANGGGPWVQVKTLAGNITGNFFATPGSAAGDYGVEVRNTQGLNLQGNRFEGPTNVGILATGGNSVAVWISGNDFQGGTPLTGQANLSASQAAANNNLLNFTV